jgi:hypothetical protein
MFRHNTSTDNPTTQTYGKQQQYYSTWYYSIILHRQWQLRERQYDSLPSDPRRRYMFGPVAPRDDAHAYLDIWCIGKDLRLRTLLLLRPVANRIRQEQGRRDQRIGAPTTRSDTRTNTWRQISLA